MNYSIKYIIIKIENTKRKTTQTWSRVGWVKDAQTDIEIQKGLKSQLKLSKSKEKRRISTHQHRKKKEKALD